MSTSFKPVEAVVRALKVLKAVNVGEKASVASIHKATGIDKATIVRMLETLVQEGYVEKDGDNPTYHVTGRVLQLSQGYQWSRSIASAAGAVLEEHRAKVGWPSDVAVFDHDAMIIAETSRAASVLSLRRAPGFRLPMLVTSAGLAYIAFVEPEQQQAIMERLAKTKDPANALAKDKNACDALFKKIRASGYAVMASEYSERISAGGLWAMAVPILSGTRVFGALNLIFIRNAITEREAVKKYMPSLQHTAEMIADRLNDLGH